MSTVLEVGEDRLVGLVIARLALGSSGSTVTSPLLVAPGDDAAVLAPGGSIVLSTDTLVAGVDFRLDWSAPEDIGAKTAAACLADIAAMGARPETLLVSLTLPGDTAVDWVLGLADGLATECARAGATVAGGDLAAGDQVVVTGTAVGRLLQGYAPVLRSGARPGDVVAVAGGLGESAAGLALLRLGSARSRTDRDSSGSHAVVLAAHRRPVPDYDAGLRAGLAGATSLIDVSDGLVRDARRVAAASAVVIDLESAELGGGAALRDVADDLGVDPTEWVLTGGEDHAMLATFSPGAALPVGFRRIGSVSPSGGDGRTGVHLDGRPYLGSGGWVHFSE